MRKYKICITGISEESRVQVRNALYLFLKLQRKITRPKQINLVFKSYKNSKHVKKKHSTKDWWNHWNAHMLLEGFEGDGV